MIGHTAPGPEPVHAAQHQPGTPDTLAAPTDATHRPPIDLSLPEAALANYLGRPDRPTVRFDRAERRLTVRGELDAAATPMLAEVMAEVMAVAPDTEPGDIMVDLTGVRFIDAAGLGALVGYANHLAARGAKLSVVGASPRLRRVFDIVQLGGLLQAS